LWASLLRTIYDLFLHVVHAPYCAYRSIGIIRKDHIDSVLERASSLGAGAVAAYLTGRPLVVEVIDQRHTRLSLKLAGKVITYRPDVLKRDLPPHLLKIVPAGANTEMFKYSRNRDHDAVGYVGSFRTWHGVEDLIRSVAILKGRKEIIELVMIGPGYEDSERLARDLGVLSLIEFTGGLPYSQVPRLLERCAIAAAPFDPSKDEYMGEHGYIFSPLKVFEYMAMGKAVVSSDLGKIREVIYDGKTGLLVQPGSPEEIAEKIALLVHNPGKGIRMGKRARKLIEARFSWNTLSLTVSKVLSELSGRTGGVDS